MAFILLLIFILSIPATGISNPGFVYAAHKSNFKPADTTNMLRVPEENAFMYNTADSSYNNDNDESDDEIILSLNVPRVGSMDISAIIAKKVAYLPVREIFDFLKIKNVLSPGIDSISGFFINPKVTYLIDKQKNIIIYDGKKYDLKETDIIRTPSNLYLNYELLGKIFGLDCKFDFRSLSITLTTRLELPIMKEMQQEQMRNNIGRLKGEKKADTTIKREFSFFHLGMADWAVLASNDSKGSSSMRFNLDLGAHIAGGEANAYLNYNNRSAIPFDLRRQYYKWKYVNNDNRVIKQFTAGKMFTQSTASLFAPIQGIQFGNTPTTYRRSFGTYRLSDKTEPGWTVELYVNDVMVNYMKADASGFFTFEVPLVYGTSVVKLRFYSPWGEERTREVNINIPFNFLPVNDFEYSLTAGIVDDDFKSKFSRLNMNYGLGSHLTIGGGIEYLSSLATNKLMPYANLSLRIGPNLLVSGEHTQGVRTKGLVSYRMPSNLQAEVSYTKYAPGQTALVYNYESEKKAILSMPFRGKKLAAFTRLTVSQVSLPKDIKYTSGELLMSAIFCNISSNLTTYAILSDAVHPLVYSNLSMSFKIPWGLRLTPQAQFEYRQNSFSMIKCELEKNLFNHGYLNISFDKDLLTHSYNAGVGVRYNFSIAQTSMSTRKTNYGTSTMLAARGSLVYDDNSKSIRLNAENNVGKGNILIKSYLDINCNGKRDEGEPLIKGLNVKVNGGKIIRNKKDSSIYITGVEAYTDYFLELDKHSLDNVAWQLPHSIIKISVDANLTTLVEVPVAVVAEASGTVFLEKRGTMEVLGRIIVNIYNSKSKLVTRVMTEADGYFSYMGLAPGKYVASIDAAQLLKLKLTSSAAVAFTVKANKEGDVIDGLKFVLRQ